MYEKIIDFLQSNNVTITDEIRLSAEQLSDLAQGGDGDISKVITWLEKKRKEYPVTTKEIGIKDVKKWHVDEKTGNVSHESGKFFTLMGVEVGGAEGREVTSWTQPMVKQNECGILGVLCKKIDGVRHYLLYAKYEPGNLHKLQLSPTLQATASNLKLAHGGKKPVFAEYFENGGKGRIITNAEAVEDGGRFYMKTNRNMLVEVPENEKLEVPDQYIWLTLPQVKKLLKRDLYVNSPARSVFGSF